MMWFAQLRLLVYWFIIILCGILTHKDNGALGQNQIQKGKQVKIEDKYGNPSRHYIEGGTATALCLSNKLASVKVNGKDATGVRVDKKDAASDENFISIPLNDKTIFGDYICHGYTKYKLHHIGYILCDTSKMVPPKVCPQGQFCVINGTTTSCRTKLYCERVSKPVECTNGTRADTGKDSSCSIYRNAENKLPRGYSLGGMNPDYCGANPNVVHKAVVVRFLSTVPISGSHELKSGDLKAKCSSCKESQCNLMTSEAENRKMKFDESDFEAWDGGLPAKMLVACQAINSEGVTRGYTRFYILFYGKDRTQFNIVQGTTVVNITDNTKDKVVHLRPKIPFNCTVKTEEGLFVEALQSKEESRDKGRIRQDSVDMGSKEVSKGKYTCIAKVYYYEQFGDIGFKLLYEEKRDVIINITAEATAATTTIATTSTQATKGGRHPADSSSTITIICCVIIGIIILVAVAVILFYFLYWRKRKNKEETKPKDHVRRHSITRKENKLNTNADSIAGETQIVMTVVDPSTVSGACIPSGAYQYDETVKHPRYSADEHMREIIRAGKKIRNIGEGIAERDSTENY